MVSTDAAGRAAAEPAPEPAGDPAAEPAPEPAGDPAGPAHAPARARRSARGRASYHHGALRQALLDGARVMLAERGAAGFSLSELARSVGVSTAAPYRHFADREALLCELADDGYRQFGAALDRAVLAADGEVDALVRLGVAYLDFAAQERALFEVMFRGDARRTSTVRPPTFHTLVGAVERAQGAGALPGEQPAPILARTLWAALHGLAVLAGRGGLAALELVGPHEEMVRDVLAPFLRAGASS